MAENNQINKLLSIGEASDYLGVSIDTLRRWEKKDKIVSQRSPGGHRYFKKEDLDNLFGTKYERTQETNRLEKKNISTPEILKDQDDKDINISQKETYNTSYTPTTYPSLDVFPDKISEDNIIDRPLRNIEIPKLEPVRVIQEKQQTSINEEQLIVKNQVSQSILTPPISIQGTPTPQVEEREIESKINTKSPKKDKVEVKKKNNMMFYAALTLLIVFAIGFIFFLIGASTQEILSPVP